MQRQSEEWLECSICREQFSGNDARLECTCGGLLSVERAPGWWKTLGPALFDSRRASFLSALDQSGVWRFREGVMAGAKPEDVVAHPEGATRLYARPALSRYAGHEALYFKHEGENPTGSFKDRGMTAAMTQAVRLGARAVACASTGNTSSSLAAYAAQAEKPAVVFVPAGKISPGKLAQTLAYGAKCLLVRGDFDAAMSLASEASSRLGIYLLNSKNAFRIEGQKTIVWELLQDLGWEAPDWISLPAGNLGNTSAFGKALKEAAEAGWIRKVPRLLCVQASGANPFFLSYQDQFSKRHRVEPETVATAIRIGNPVSYERARAALAFTRGVVTQVTDDELLMAKREIDAAGIGCEPASACSLAGVKQMRERGEIKPGERVVCVLTGNVLKDSDAILRTQALLPTQSPTSLEVRAEMSEVESALARLISY